MTRVVKPDGILAIVLLTIRMLMPGERLLSALLILDLVVTIRGRCAPNWLIVPIAQISAVLGLLRRAGVPTSKAEEEGVLRRRSRALEHRIAERLNDLEEMGLVGADYFVSPIGPAFEVFARYSRVVSSLAKR